MMDLKIDNYIKNLNYDELVVESKKFGLERYRAEQIFTGIYANRSASFDEITTLPLHLREDLSSRFTFDSITIDKKRVSTDGSIKYLFRLHDDKHVEAVYMPWYDEDGGEIERVTLCISSMAGCPVECAFCATGTLGLLRNLETAEIIDQIMLVERDLGTKITNIVFMGMGEPLLNYRNVIRSINIMAHEKAQMLSRRKITLSTVGITAKIRQLAREQNPPKLALSLHATTDGVRSKIIPSLKNVSVGELFDAIEDYYRVTHMPITYEYIPFDGINDTDADAKRLARITKRVPSRVNLIPFNDISFAHPSGFGKELRPTPKDKVAEFGRKIRDYGGRVTIRDTFGTDIEAACGQLALSE